LKAKAHQHTNYVHTRNGFDERKKHVIIIISRLKREKEKQEKEKEEGHTCRKVEATTA